MSLLHRLAAVLHRARAPRPLGAAVAVAVVAPLAVAAVVGEGIPAVQLEQHAGSAWLASPTLGYVTLVDGPSRAAAATVLVAERGHHLQVTQAGSSAYVVDAAAGHLARVGGAQQRVSRRIEAGDPGSDLRVAHGGDAVWLVDATQRVATQVDPTSLDPGSVSAMAAVPGPDQAVVDDHGTLWVVDSVAGGLVRVRASDQERVATVPADARLLVVRGESVLVQVTERSVAPLGDDGRQGAPTCLDVRPGDALQLLGSANRDEVVAAVSATGAVLISELGSRECDRVVPGVGGSGGAADFGPLAETGPFVFVPDRASGRVAVVDTRRDEVATTFDVAEPGSEVELIAEDGLVFYNDLGGHRAGVLTWEGGQWRDSPVDKYDPGTGTPAVPVLPPDAPTLPSPEVSPTRGPEGSPSPGSEESPRESAGPRDEARREEPRTPGASASATRPTLTASITGPPDAVAGADTTLRVLAGGATVVRSVWDFGDGATADVQDDEVTHRWRTARAEPYVVEVTVTTADGRRASATFPIRIGDRPPVLLTVSRPTGGTIVDATTPSAIDCPGRCSATYPAEAAVTLRAVPAVGMRTAAWTGACEGVAAVEHCTLALVEPVTAGALFEVDPDRARTLTVTAPADGAVVSTDGLIDCPGTCAAGYPADTEVVLQAFPSSRWAGWSGDCDGSTTRTCALQVTGSHTISATFGACPVTACVTFERAPGQPLHHEPVLLDPDAFAGTGLVGLGAAPLSSYCAGAVAGLEPGTLGGHQLPEPALTTRLPGEPRRCNTVPVDIGFAHPVRWVSVRFLGAAEPYVLTAYRADGSVIGTTSATPGSAYGTATAEFSGTGIARVTLGFTTGVIGVMEVRFDR